LRKLIVVLVLLWPLPGLAGLQAGDGAYKRGDFATAMREWRPLAEQGNADAQYNLGVIYDFGKGVPEDDAEGATW
jgi:TPR repeat protein